MNHRCNKRGEDGFALLITLVVVSVVLAIGLSLLFVTTKQYVLAVTASESEKAFQAANVGLECMRWHRAQPATLVTLLREGGNWPPSLNCAGETPDSPPGVQASTLYSQNNQFFYNYKYTYTTKLGQCIETSMYIADVRTATADFDRSISGEGLSSINCTAGTFCTAIFSRGYNRPCDQLDSILTIQREITIEY